MEKNICYTITKVNDCHVKIYTKSSLAIAGLKEIVVREKSVFQFMKALASRYNNNPDGCIGIEFVVE